MPEACSADGDVVECAGGGGAGGHESGPAAPAVDAGERAVAGDAGSGDPRLECVRPLGAGGAAGVGGAGAGRLDEYAVARALAGAGHAGGALAAAPSRRLSPGGGGPDRVLAPAFAGLRHAATIRPRPAKRGPPSCWASSRGWAASAANAWRCRELSYAPTWRTPAPALRSACWCAQQWRSAPRTRCWCWMPASVSPCCRRKAPRATWCARPRTAPFAGRSPRPMADAGANRPAACWYAPWPAATSTAPSPPPRPTTARLGKRRAMCSVREIWDDLRLARRRAGCAHLARGGHS